MSTMVCFHAHPDDECIVTGGVMAKAAAEGHRVVLVVATGGEAGEVPDGFLDDDEELADRRAAETHRAAEVLGVARVEFLGYHDSGMAGTPANDAPGAFCRADVDDVAAKLAALLAEEGAEVLTAYDEIGGYGHPDHIQVHRVGLRAADLAGTPRTYLATLNRDHIRRGVAELRDRGADVGDLPDFEADEPFGMPEELITTTVDVSAFIDSKRRAMAAHASQISEQSFFLTMAPEVFGWAFGQEWFIRVGGEPGAPGTSLFPEEPADAA